MTFVRWSHYVYGLLQKNSQHFTWFGENQPDFGKDTAGPEPSSPGKRLGWVRRELSDLMVVRRVAEIACLVNEGSAVLWLARQLLGAVPGPFWGAVSTGDQLHWDGSPSRACWGWGICAASAVSACQCESWRALEEGRQ